MSRQTIVITGSTRGIGYGLAAEFLKLGHNVVVTGRSDGQIGKHVLRRLCPTCARSVRAEKFVRF